VRISRRKLLGGAIWSALLSSASALARVVSGALPWRSNAGTPPVPVLPGPWQFFTRAEAGAIEALVDRLIPPDPHTPGGKDAGCAVFIDRQLAGPYGRSSGLYMQGPFLEGTAEQGPQSPLTPSVRYRQALAALDRYCRDSREGRAFAQLADAEKDAIIAGLEKDEIKLAGADGRAFFEQLLANAREGFFCDPIYGGNRDMVAWRMIGFPGTRYDYRHWVDRHNERFPLPPVSMLGRSEWRKT
jgi:gluconate 2-dehydrogenase gamma chain